MQYIPRLSYWLLPGMSLGLQDAREEAIQHGDNSAKNTKDSSNGDDGSADQPLDLYTPGLFEDASFYATSS